jgi:3D-(3,5/4)-trihydroxycyclohexane-1,2-dione acylhydrolase (decyclizing)
MGKTIRLTMAQAVVRFLKNQMTVIDGETMPIFGGVWAIFGHGNVAGMGEALYQVREELPTYRAHNEQSMAHAAIAYSKAMFRQRFMACTTSIGPGALNMVTAAGVAHVDRLPVLFLPGDVFANRVPDPVLQQVENFSDGTVSVNDAFRPVCRYFDRITRPEQIIPALKRAMQVMTDPVDCGPVCLSLCQDVQAEAFDYPESFFAEKVWSFRRQRPDDNELASAIAAIRSAKAPVIIAGGGVLYSRATAELAAFAETHGVPVVVTQAGKSGIDERLPMAMGSVGVTGTSAANVLTENADVIIAVGSRLQDFTTGSWAIFKNPDVTFIGINTASFDAAKHSALPVVGDAKVTLSAMSVALGGWNTGAAYRERAASAKAEWMAEADKAMAATNAPLPSDAQVIGGVARHLSGENTVLLCASGGLPGELHKLWPATSPGSYHLEYGFSCMGYEIAGGLGVKMARPDAEVVVMVGDGSYMMMNSELATAVMLRKKLTVVLLDNRGFGCINRLQMATGGANFNNLLKDAYHEELPDIDFAKHAESMGAVALKVGSITELEQAIKDTRDNGRTTVIVIDTDPLITTEAGGHWWDVAVPEVSSRETVNQARAAYVEARKQQILN